MMREDAFCMNTHIFFLKDSNNSFIAIKFFAKIEKIFLRSKFLEIKMGSQGLLFANPCFICFFLLFLHQK